MPGAIIVINQPTGAGAGTADVARDDIWAGQAVHLVVGTAGNSSVQWELLDVPPGSTATIANANQSGGGPYAPGIITPDLRGTYRVRLLTNGGGPGNTSVKVFRVRFDNTGALLGRGWAFPAFGEQPVENNTVSSAGRSYVQVLSDIIEDALSVVVAAAGVPTMTPDVIMSRDSSGNTAANEVYTGRVTSAAGLGRLATDLAITAASGQQVLLEAGATLLLSAFLSGGDTHLSTGGADLVVSAPSVALSGLTVNGATAGRVDVIADAGRHMRLFAGAASAPTPRGLYFYTRAADIGGGTEAGKFNVYYDSVTNAGGGIRLFQGDENSSTLDASWIHAGGRILFRADAALDVAVAAPFGQSVILTTGPGTTNDQAYVAVTNTIVTLAAGTFPDRYALDLTTQASLLLARSDRSLQLQPKTRTGATGYPLYLYAGDSSLGAASFGDIYYGANVHRFRSGSESVSLLLDLSTSAVLLQPSHAITVQGPQVGAGAGLSATFAGSRGAAGSSGGKTIIGADNGGNPGTDVAGGIDLQLGTAVAGESSKLILKAGSTELWHMYSASGYAQLRSVAANIFFGVPSAGLFQFGQNSGSLPTNFLVFSSAVTLNTSTLALGFTNVPATIAQLSTTELRFGLNASVGAAGRTLVLAGGNGAAGFAGGRTVIGANNGGTPGTDLAGGVDLQIGQPVGATSGLFRVMSNTDVVLQVDRYASVYTRLQPASGGLLIPAGSGLLSLESYNRVQVRNASSGSVSGVVFDTDHLVRRDAGTVNEYSRSIVASGSISTTTTTILASYVSSTDTAFTAVGKVTFRNSTDNQAASVWIVGLFRNVSGTLTQVGATHYLFPPIKDAAQTGLDATFSIAGVTLHLNAVTDSTDTVVVRGLLEPMRA